MLYSYFKVSRVIETRGNKIKSSEPSMCLLHQDGVRLLNVFFPRQECICRFCKAHLFQPEHSPLLTLAVKYHSLVHLLCYRVLVALSSSFIYY